MGEGSGVRGQEEIEGASPYVPVNFIDVCLIDWCRMRLVSYLCWLSPLCNPAFDCVNHFRRKTEKTRRQGKRNKVTEECMLKKKRAGEEGRRTFCWKKHPPIPWLALTVSGPNSLYMKENLLLF